MAFSRVSNVSAFNIARDCTKRFNISIGRSSARRLRCKRQLHKVFNSTFKHGTCICGKNELCPTQHRIHSGIVLNIGIRLTFEQESYGVHRQPLHGIFETHIERRVVVIVLGIDVCLQSIQANRFTSPFAVQNTTNDRSKRTFAESSKCTNLTRSIA